jgi:hypothetical protein
MAATKVRRRQRSSSAPRLASTRERCSTAEPTAAWWFSSTEASLYRSASTLLLFT